MAFGFYKIIVKNTTQAVIEKLQKEYDEKLARYLLEEQEFTKLMQNECEFLRESFITGLDKLPQNV